MMTLMYFLAWVEHLFTMYDDIDVFSSMGGALAVHVAKRDLIPSLIGLAVIDVVEGRHWDWFIDII